MEGFKKGFSLQYEGTRDRADTSDNLPLRVGNKTILWNKLMKEVKTKRVAGPFEQVPYDQFIQSPIGLVPKDGGKTRLIFHLSYKFKNGNISLNRGMPAENCRVAYRDLDHAVQNCIKLLKKAKLLGANTVIYYGKTDVQSVFRLVPLRCVQFCLLIMKANHPITGKLYYFVDKCLPFRASISCKIFQSFSDAIHFIFESSIGNLDITTNYLDDFLLIALSFEDCNKRVAVFLALCNKLGALCLMRKQYGP